MEGSPYSSYTPLPTTEPPKKAPKRLRLLWATLVILGVIGVTAAFLVNRTPANAAATVNGEIVTKEDVEKRVAQVVVVYNAQGVLVEDEDLINELRTQALQTAITDTLLLQEAERVGISVSSMEVDARFDEFVGIGQDIQAMLVAAGLSAEDVRQHINNQIAIEKLVENYTKLHGVAASESDMQDLYKQITKTEAATSSFEEAQKELRERVIKQKTDKLMIEYVNNLRANAKIRIY